MTQTSRAQPACPWQGFPRVISVPSPERVMLSQMDCTSVEMFVKGMTLSSVSGARKKQGGDNTGEGV